MDENEEEKDDDLTEEKIARLRKVKGKMDKFMLEISADLLDEEDKKLAEKKITELLKHQGIPATISYVKAFAEGFQMSMAAMMDDKQTAMMALATIFCFIDRLDTDMKSKVDKAMKEKLK